MVRSSVSGLANPPSNLTAEHATGIEHALSYDASMWPTATAGTRGMMAATDYSKLLTLQVPLLCLNVAASTDIMNAAAIAATTWTDLMANQSFTVSSTASLLAVYVRLGFHASCAGGATSISARAVFDSAGTPTNVNISSGFIAAAGQFGSLSGGFFFNNGMAAGTHTIKLQVWSDLATVGYCRANGSPNIEWASIGIVELNP